MACPRQTRRASVHRVRTARAFILYIAVVFLGAALIAPWIHSAGQAIAEAFPASANTFNQPFHRYVNRSLLILAIIGIWPLSKFLNVQGRAHLGFPSRASWHRELATGFLAGFVSLAAAAGMAMAAGARILHPDLTLERFLSAASSAIATAAIVALVEELLFRGVIFGQLLRATSCLTALIFSSAVYAIVHFFQRPPSPSEITPWTGIWTLGQMLRGFVLWDSLIPGFLNLFVAGWALAELFRRTGAVYASIGLHAGWIFWLKLWIAATAVGPQASAWVWGSSRLVDGWTTLPLLLACVVWARRQGSPS